MAHFNPRVVVDSDFQVAPELQRFAIGSSDAGPGRRPTPGERGPRGPAPVRCTFLCTHKVGW